MTEKENAEIAAVEALLDKLVDDERRDPQLAAEARARFLAQAGDLAPVRDPAPVCDPALAVSAPPERRHTGCNNNNFFERIWKSMKPQAKLFALLTMALLVAVIALTTYNVTAVSAQKILDRAAAAQAVAGPAQGITYTRIETYENPQALPGEAPGTKTLIEDYFDLATGYSRRVTWDMAGQVIEASANDETYSYSTFPTGEVQPSAGLTVYRTPLSPDEQRKLGVQAGASDQSQHAAFDQFRSNPRVELKGKITWLDGRQAYLLAAQSYQTRKLPNGQDEKTLTGATQMIFDAQTYQLLEYQTSLRKDGQDIVIDGARFLVDEVLPADSRVAWDLSDLKGIVMVDERLPEASASEEVPFETLSLDDLLQRIQTKTYLLRPLPEEFTLEIVAAANQPADEPYQYELNYSRATGESFDMMAVGVMDPGFVEKSFYDSSYKTASGLVLYFSPSSNESASEGQHTSAMLVTPGGDSFLVFSSLSREQTQALVEKLVAVP